MLVARSGFEVIEEGYDTIISILKRHYLTYGGGIIPRIMKGALSEVSFYGKDPETGLEVKIRPDAIQTEENIGVNAIISFKTTRAESVAKFLYDCAALKYQITEGMYSEVATHITGRKFNTVIMVVLQTVEPYLPMLLWWSAEDLALGKHQYHHTMYTIREAIDKGLFPGFDAQAEEGNYGIIDTELPSWAHSLTRPVNIED